MLLPLYKNIPGDPVVGRVTNLHVLEDMLQQPHLIFKEFIF